MRRVKRLTSWLRSQWIVSKFICDFIAICIYIIPKDKRDLNYDKYFEKGLSEFKELSEYNSSNTYQLNSKEIAKLINKFKVLNSFIE